MFGNKFDDGHMIHQQFDDVQNVEKYRYNYYIVPYVDMAS